MSISAEALRKLAQFDTPTVCNALELFHVRPRNTGFMDARIKSCFPDLPPMVGFALTTGFRSDAPPPGGDVYGGMEEQVARFDQLAGPAVLVFQDLDDPSVSATFGEVMCTAYQAFGSTGLITSGTGRDLEQVKALNYPVFTNGAICSHGYCHMLNIGLPVRVGGLMVQTGDLLHGDANGVTEIPVDVADELGDVCAEFVEAEQIVLNYLRGSATKSPEGFRQARAEYSKVISGITKRVSRQPN